MVNVRWAVACLLAGFILGAAGCAAGKVAKTPPPNGGAGESGTGDNVTITPMPVVAAAGAITEEAILDKPLPLKGAAPVVAADNGVKPSAPAQPTPHSSPEYRLGPEDVLRISVWENKELTLDLVVRPDGKISMPLIHDVTAEGMTAVELGAQIQHKLLAFMKDPQVSVVVLQVNAPKYYVIGYVAKPGTYPLRGDTSVLQALALAGGFTQFASPRSIKLIRNSGGKQDVRKVNYYNMIDEGGEGNLLLKSGDTIVVP